MSKIYIILSAIGAAFASIVGVFFYAKGKGGEEVKDGQRKKILDDIQTFHKVNKDTNDLSDEQLNAELHDDSTCK